VVVKKRKRTLGQSRKKALGNNLRVAEKLLQIHYLMEGQTLARFCQKLVRKSRQENFFSRSITKSKREKDVKKRKWLNI
jgi:hypothetical protein